MRFPRLEGVDLSPPEPAGKFRRSRSAGWAGVFSSVGIALGGLLTRQSESTFVFVAGALLLVSLVVLGWARLWLREAREPFPFTYSVGEFEQRSTGFDPNAQTAAMLNWISRDLISSLSNRVQRLSLFEGDESAVVEGSHVHIGGWFGIRRRPRSYWGGSSRRWQLEIVPQVRLGGREAPAKLGQVVRYDLGDSSYSGAPPQISRDQYDSAFEQVYWSVASEVYAQIGEAVKGKIALLPPGRLRAAAYLYEADDYAASNTLDAYAAARRLYEKARRIYDVSARPAPATRWRQTWHEVHTWLARLAYNLRLRLAKASRRAARREVLVARAELGVAKMQVLEWHLKWLCGSRPEEIYAVVPLLEKAIGRLCRLPADVGEREEVLYRGRVVLAMTRQLLGDEAEAKRCIDQIRAMHSRLARNDPEFFFVAGLNEKSRLRSQRLLGQAVELGSKLERAHFHRALRSDHVWRSRPTFEAEVANSVDREYQAVVSIDPGNLSAWANRGYMAWLLADGDDADAWREKALAALEAGREYKEVRSEAIVAELDWNLARIAAETGNFPKAYEHYSGAVSAQLGDNPVPFGSYFYENAGDALVKRFKRYRERVRDHVESSPPDQKRLANAVLAFACNDCGLAFEHYRARSGDEEALDWSVEAFEEAIDIGDSVILPAYNLARLHQRLAWAASSGQPQKRRKELLTAASLLAEALRSEPDWIPAQLVMANVQTELHAELTAEMEELREATDDETGEVKEREADSARRSRIAELKEDCKRCRAQAVANLGRMLPSAYFTVDGDSRASGDLAYRVDLEGSDIAALIADERIKWLEDFNQFQVLALIEWASALADTEATARVAFELCELLRRTFHHSNEKLLIAHGKAAEALARSSPGDGFADEDPEMVVYECRDLLMEGVRRVLEDDPAHYGMLSHVVFDWLSKPDQRDLLLKARAAQPSPLALLSIGNRLHDLDESSEACKVLAQAAEDGGAEVRPTALLRLGELQAKRERWEKAINAYGEAARSGNAEIAPQAALRAMNLLAEQERRDAALSLVEEVASSRPEIGLVLGRTLQGEVAWKDGAETAFVKVCDAASEEDVRNAALLGLGRLLDPADPKAEPVLREAATSGDSGVRAEAQVLLAQALSTEPGNEREMEALLRAALASGVQGVEEEARFYLAHLLDDQGEQAEARALFEQVVAQGDESATVLAASALATMLEGNGDTDGAREVCAEAAERHSWAALSLARMVHERGDRATAERLSRIGATHVGESGLYAPDCLVLLADLLVDDEKRMEEAEETYWKAIDSEDVSVMPGAAQGLAKLYEKTGRKADEAYRAVMAKLDDVTAMTVAYHLCPALEEAGEANRATVLYIAAAARGSWAAMQIGDRLIEEDNAELAAKAYEAGLDSDGLFEEENMIRLGRLIVESDSDRAEDLFRRVRDGGGPEADAARESLVALAGQADRTPA